MIKSVGAMVAIVGLLGAFWGGIEWHQRFALADQVQTNIHEMEMKVELNRLNNLYQRSLDNYYRAKELVDMHPGESEAQEAYETALEDKEMIKEQLMDLKGKM